MRKRETERDGREHILWSEKARDRERGEENRDTGEERQRRETDTRERQRRETDTGERQRRETETEERHRFSPSLLFFLHPFLTLSFPPLFFLFSFFFHCPPDDCCAVGGSGLTDAAEAKPNRESLRVVNPKKKILIKFDFWMDHTQALAIRLGLLIVLFSMFFLAVRLGLLFKKFT